MTSLLTAAVVLMSPALAGLAQAAVSFREITSTAGPLTSIALGDELSCQIAVQGDAGFAMFPPTAKPGDCGTFMFVAGTLFAPNFAAHDATATSALGATTPFTPVSQSAVSGDGTVASPFAVTTVADAGSSVRITQVDSYISGQEVYRTDTTIVSLVGGAPEGILYRAGHCHLQQSGTGFGFVDPAAGAVGCSISPKNTPRSRSQQWFPIINGNRYMEARYDEIWARIASHTALPDSTRAAESVDHGAAISWSFQMGFHELRTYSHYTMFSRRTAAAPPVTGSTKKAVSRFKTAFATRAAARGAGGQLIGVAEVTGVSKGSTVNVRCLRGCRLDRTYKPSAAHPGLTLRRPVSITARSRLRVTVAKVARTARYVDYRFRRTRLGLVAKRIGGGCAGDVRGRVARRCP